LWPALLGKRSNAIAGAAAVPQKKDPEEKK